MDAMRQRNLYGERHNHCYTSPVYREKTRKINTKLAEAFRDHPGVIAWHISNELGGECHWSALPGGISELGKTKIWQFTGLKPCMEHGVLESYIPEF